MAFRKLGRNIALFQQLEFGLKTLFTELVIEGHSADDVARRRAERAAVLATSSLGLVAKKLFDELVAEDPDTGGDLPEGARVYVRARIRFEVKHIDARRTALATLIEERNQLVHHLNQRYDLHSPEGIARLVADLDPQAERIRSELKEISNLFESIARSRQQLATDFSSPAFAAVLSQSHLWQSPLIQGLIRWAPPWRATTAGAPSSLHCRDCRQRSPRRHAASPSATATRA